MRIAYVCTDPGIPVFGSKGASIHVQAVLTELVAAGHDVHLLTPRPGGTPAPDSPLRRVQVHPLPEVGTGATAQRELSAQASDRAVGDLLNRLRPDLVYERYALWGRTATAWAHAAGARSVLEVNAPLVEEQRRFRELVDADAAEQVTRSVFAAAGVVVCVSAAVAGWVRSRSSRPERVHVVANGVDPSRISSRAGVVTPADASAFTVGFVGTLKAWHGTETLVAAVGRLRQEDPSWRLLVVGDGPQRAALEDQAQCCGLGGGVEFTGALAADAVSAHLNRMDLACAPYGAGDHAYFSPLKIYEYLAAGVPVVASAVGQIPEALDYGALGRLVPPGAVTELAQALAEARADLDWRVRVGRAGRQAAVERHSWRGVVDHILRVAAVPASRSTEEAA